jgi:branched-chain amino acid transport system substrate-binding protein
MLVLRKYAAIVVASAAASNAISAEPLKVGLILPMSGTFSGYGKQIENGVRLYLQQNGDLIAGRKVELIVKDDTGAAPEISKRLAQELVVRDKVDILAGFAMTPAAFAVAPIATEAKKPMVVMNAGTSNLTTKSPYIVRTSATVAQYTMPLGTWTANNNMKKAFTMVADFGPGHDAENYFKKSYTGAGGQIVGELRVPLKNPDFAPFLQKIKDTKPDVVFVFLPAGELAIAFLKGFKERNLAGEGIKIVATGDLTDDDSIDAIGAVSLGVVSAHHYSEAHQSPENKTYTDAYYKAYPNARPNFMSVGGYDGMRLIAETLKKTNGDATGDKFMAAVKGMQFVSPRGPVSIDPETRDIVETIYMRKVERVGAKLMNVEFDDSFKNYKDPGKTASK